MIIIYSKSNIFDIKIIKISFLIVFTFNNLINKCFICWLLLSNHVANGHIDAQCCDVYQCYTCNKHMNLSLHSYLLLVFIKSFKRMIYIYHDSHQIFHKLNKSHTNQC
jgi:hypothetical protein